MKMQKNLRLMGATLVLVLSSIAPTYASNFGPGTVTAAPVLAEAPAAAPVLAEAPAAAPAAAPGALAIAPAAIA